LAELDRGASELPLSCQQAAQECMCLGHSEIGSQSSSDLLLRTIEIIRRGKRESVVVKMRGKVRPIANGAFEAVEGLAKLALGRQDPAGQVPGRRFVWVDLESFAQSRRRLLQLALRKLNVRQRSMHAGQIRIE